MTPYIHPNPSTPPAYVQVQATAPAAGAAGTSDVAKSSAPPSGRAAAASDNGGQRAGTAVPGGTNHAPDVGKKPDSFSKPIHAD